MGSIIESRTSQSIKINMEDRNMQGQIQYPGNISGARTNTMQNGFGEGISTGLGIATGVGIFILALYGLSQAFRGN
jgi:hypothetical protein